MLEPFAIQIYKQYMNGESIEQLAAKLGIPAERIEWRIRAAAAYFQRFNEKLAA